MDGNRLALPEGSSLWTCFWALVVRSLTKECKSLVLRAELLDLKLMDYKNCVVFEKRHISLQISNCGFSLLEPHPYLDSDQELCLKQDSLYCSAHMFISVHRRCTLYWIVHVHPVLVCTHVFYPGVHTFVLISMFCSVKGPYSTETLSGKAP